MDAIVIGAGPNGLTAAAVLARRGWRVVVLEANARPGGAAWSEESTLPGYLHDVGAAFFPFAHDSIAFRDLDLAGAGLEWRNAPHESCHPALDGTAATISRDAEVSARHFGADGPAWHRLASWMRSMGPRLSEALLSPLPGIRPALRLGPANLARFARVGLGSTAAFSARHFRTEAARRVVPGLALHVDLGPDDAAGAGLGLVLGLLASSAGFCIPVGGARAITQALLRRLTDAGGELHLNQRADRILVENGRPVAVKTATGEEYRARAVLADVGPAALYAHLLRDVPGMGGTPRQARRFRYGWGTFKMDWALSGPVPWAVPEARQSAVVHSGESVADLRRFTRQVRAARLPANPYLVIGQQSLVDPSRAPEGGHTLWAYSRVPSILPEGWPARREFFADVVEQRIEGLAPGFKSLIRARHIVAPPDLESMNANLVGGDLGGGSARIDQQLFLRPFFPWFGYATPIRGVYLCSASTHPGAGVHGACGYNAAMRALREAEV